MPPWHSITMEFSSFCGKGFFTIYLLSPWHLILRKYQLTNSLPKYEVGVIRLGEMTLCLLLRALFAPIRSPDATL